MPFTPPKHKIILTKNQKIGKKLLQKIILKSNTNIDDVEEIVEKYNLPPDLRLVNGRSFVAFVCKKRANNLNLLKWFYDNEWGNQSDYDDALYLYIRNSKYKDKDKIVNWLIDVAGARHPTTIDIFTYEIKHQISLFNKSPISHKLLFYFYRCTNETMLMPKSIEIIKNYITRFHNICELDEDGNSYLHSFANFYTNDFISCASYLFYPFINPLSKQYIFGDQKVDVNLQNNKGETWIHIFAKNLLLNNGYKSNYSINNEKIPINSNTLSIKDNDGNTFPEIFSKKIKEKFGDDNEKVNL